MILRTSALAISIWLRSNKVAVSFLRFNTARRMDALGDIVVDARHFRVAGGADQHFMKAFVHAPDRDGIGQPRLA